MRLAIIDYGSGNLRSAAKAFERVAAEAGLAAEIRVTNDPAIVAASDRVVLPGDGAFATCMAGLVALDGMIEALEEAVIRGGRPFLGICVGMQLMATAGLEHGRHDGLGWIAGEVRALAPGAELKVPHMGWNELALRQPGHKLLDGLPANAHAYFIHSFQFFPADRDRVLAEADHGGPVTAILAQDNFAGTQFHPEKSGAAGLRLLHNFIEWRP